MAITTVGASVPGTESEAFDLTCHWLHFIDV